MPLAHLNCSQERHLIREVALQSLTTCVYIGNILDQRELHTISFGNVKQLLDDAFVINRMVKVGVNSPSQSLWLITLNKILFNLDITKTECNNCFIIH